MNRPTWKHVQQTWEDRAFPAVIRLLRPLRHWLRVRRERLTAVEIRGLGRVTSALAAGDGVMITPNHSSHADPYVMYYAADRIPGPVHFMAAASVFAAVPRPVRWLLQAHGCFSVDREGTDLRAFRRAVEILQRSPWPLVIFPEGEVYHLNDRITPFRDGPAVIALSAHRLARRPLRIVPAAIRYRFVRDPSPELEAVMTRLEERLNWRPLRRAPLADRIVRYATGQVALKELEYLGQIQAGGLVERIDRLRESILAPLEARYGTGSRQRSVPERVKEVRRAGLAARGKPGITPGELEAIETDLEDVFVATQLWSYPGDWLRGKPSIERLAETLDKLEEDALGLPTARIRGARRAIVSFGEPMDVSSWAAGSSRRGAPALTAEIERRVQALLDETLPRAPAEGSSGG